MHETLADIEALSLRCQSEQSRGYISEAILCYRSGAYRAAIVSTWIALVFDLIDKVRELALSGDSVAKALEEKYEKYINQIEQNNPSGIKGALEFEREILETCKNQLQFFDPQQYLDLLRVREDRHRCAHPSFLQVGLPYNPPAEQARLHIRNVIVHVLSEPPVQGKAALAKLSSTVSSPYFPTTEEGARTLLVNNGLNRPTDSLVKGALDLLLFGYVTSSSALFNKKQSLVAINAIHTLKPAIAAERIKTQVNKIVNNVSDPDFDKAIVLAADVYYAGDILDESSKVKIKSFIETGANLPSIIRLHKLPPFTALVQTRVNNLNFEDLLGTIHITGAHIVFKTLVLELLSEARDWVTANIIFSKGVTPLFDLLTADDAIRILRMPRDTQADLKGSNGMRLFREQLESSQLIPADELHAHLVELNYIYATDLE